MRFFFFICHKIEHRSSAAIRPSHQRKTLHRCSLLSGLAAPQGKVIDISFNVFQNS